MYVMHVAFGALLCDFGCRELELEWHACTYVMKG